MFDYDWFHGPAFKQQKQEAKWRCALQHFPHVDPQHARDNPEVTKFYADLQDRTLIYLRDGFSYELKDMADVAAKSHLVFECMPVDEHYKVGTFVVTLPFDEIVRVEVFAVHPNEKPDDLPQITGFRAPPEPGEHPRYPEAKPAKPHTAPPRPAKPGR